MVLDTVFDKILTSGEIRSIWITTVFSKIRSLRFFQNLSESSQSLAKSSPLARFCSSWRSSHPEKPGFKMIIAVKTIDFYILSALDILNFVIIIFKCCMLEPPPNTSFCPLPCSNQYLRPHPDPILEGTFLPLPLYCLSSKFPIPRPLLHPLFLLSRRCSNIMAKEGPGCVCWCLPAEGAGGARGLTFCHGPPGHSSSTSPPHSLLRYQISCASASSITPCIVPRKVGV